MCNNTKKDCEAKKQKLDLSVFNRFTLGRDVKAGTYFSDKKSGKVLFETHNSGYREYSLLQIAAVVAVGLFGFLYTFINLKKGMQRKKTIKLQEKELKKLRKLCKNVDEEKK